MSQHQSGGRGRRGAIRGELFEHAARHFALARHHQVDALLAQVRHGGAGTGAGVDRQARIDPARHAHDLAGLERIRREDNPSLPHFDLQDHATPPPASLALDGLVRAFADTRQQTLDFLTDLNPGEWQRPAGLDLQGGTTLRWQVVDMMNHDLAHLGQLVDIRVKWEAGTVRDNTEAVSPRA